MARHTAKSHKIRKVEILVIQIIIFQTEKWSYHYKEISFWYILMVWYKFIFDVKKYIDSYKKM